MSHIHDLKWGKLRKGKWTLPLHRNSFRLILMENKKKSATNEKVSKYIPHDIAFSILHKLPLKSLKRFGCVRKSWSLLLQDTRFMNMFRNNFISNSHRYHDGAPIMLRVYDAFQSGHDVLYSFSGHRFENKIKLDCPNLFEEELNNFKIFGLGSSDGTLCLHGLLGLDSCKITLWNPITDLFNPIPPSPVESSLPDAAKVIFTVVSSLHGFGYDRGTCDYKVIRRVHLQCDANLEYVPSNDILGDSPLDQYPIWEIYSLRSNSWKKLDFDMPGYVSCIEGIQAYMDGFCHWLCVHRCRMIPCLVSFDLSNDVFFKTPIPSYVDDCFDVKAKWINLAVLNGFIALLSYNEKTTTFHISILNEHGVKESWTKLFVIGSMSCVKYPIGMGTKGEIFFIRKDKKLAWFNLSTQTIEELAYKPMWYSCRIIIYNKSIFPIEE
ncbi:F-box protein interaction domain protein [Medicago truncatula]|uniref:F-box protein interaction domain protein n=1 Tax=Medicago truncatula TaxID=3880 RepID=A0A072UCP3_MEDTR|nr:F-box protein interaction domain protein [Medicago truncatula]